MRTSEHTRTTEHPRTTIRRPWCYHIPSVVHNVHRVNRNRLASAYCLQTTDHYFLDRG